ncbi:hypothetical protein WICMUC_002603, partial [Wickerhamomyces mucosus]
REQLGLCRPVLPFRLRRVLCERLVLQSGQQLHRHGLSSYPCSRRRLQRRLCHQAGRQQPGPEKKSRERLRCHLHFHRPGDHNVSEHLRLSDPNGY